MGIPTGLIEAAADELRGLIQDASDQISDGVPNWVKDGEPQSINGKIAQAAARQTCNKFAADPSSFGEYDQAKLPDLCRPYLGPRSTPDYEPMLPFSGGQCTFNYDVFAVRTRTAGAFIDPNDPPTGCANDGEVQLSPPGGLPGPIGGIQASPITIPGGFKGRSFALLNGGPPFNLGVLLAGCSSYGYSQLRVTPTNPLNTDSCGTQPPTIRPPTPVSPAPPNPAPYPLPPGPDIDIDIRPRPDGGWEICVEDVCVYIDPFAPPGGGGGGGQPGLPPGDQGEPGAGGETGEGGEEEGEAEPGQVLVGLLLELITIPPYAKQIGPGIYRGPAWIYMGGDVGLDQDFAGSNLAEVQFVNSETDNATRWKVVANTGYNIRTTPFYREVEE